MEAFYKLFLNKNTNLLNYCSAFKYRYLFFFFAEMLPCAISEQSNSIINCVALCKNVRGSLFAPFRGIMVGRGEGSGGAFYPFDFKRRDDYRNRIFLSTYVMHLFCFFLWSMVCIEWNELVKYCLLSDFFPSPLYQAIMENPLVQLSLNNARILGGTYIRQKLGNSIIFHFALCQFCFSNKEVKMWP